MKRYLLIGISLLTLALAFGIILFQWYRPYGMRDAYLPIMLGALELYASDHEGYYPNVNGDPYQSLRLLYPDYIYNPELLAGITGDRRIMFDAIYYDREFPTNACSWVYWPGFHRRDSNRLAIIWEKTPEIAFNGGRLSEGSHAVGFSYLHHRVVLGPDWDQFVRNQARVRSDIMKTRIPMEIKD